MFHQAPFYSKTLCWKSNYPVLSWMRITQLLEKETSAALCLSFHDLWVLGYYSSVNWIGIEVKIEMWCPLLKAFTDCIQLNASCNWDIFFCVLQALLFNKGHPINITYRVSWISDMVSTRMHELNLRITSFKNT